MRCSVTPTHIHDSAHILFSFSRNMKSVAGGRANSFYGKPGVRPDTQTKDRDEPMGSGGCGGHGLQDCYANSFVIVVEFQKREEKTDAVLCRRMIAVMQDSVPHWKEAQ
jgi:hypothetical protein